MADPQGTANAPLAADQTLSQRLGEMEFVLEFGPVLTRAYVRIDLRPEACTDAHGIHA